MRRRTFTDAFSRWAEAAKLISSVSRSSAIHSAASGAKGQDSRPSPAPISITRWPEKFASERIVLSSSAEGSTRGMRQDRGRWTDERRRLKDSRLKAQGQRTKGQESRKKSPVMSNQQSHSASLRGL